MARSGERNRGFTLLELVLVVGIFGMVMTMAYQILNSTIEAERRVTRNTRTGKVGEGILTQMRRDLQGAVWRSYGPDVFRGIDSGSGDDAQDEFHFITTAPVPVPEDEPELYAGDAASVGYVLRSGGPDGLSTLYRRVNFDLVTSPLEDGQYHEIYNRVQGMEIRYLAEENEWIDEWDRRAELEELESQNFGTYTPYADQRTADEEEAELAAQESGDPSALPDPILPTGDEDEEFPIPLPIPRAVEIVLYIAVGDERGLYVDDDGERLNERVSTIVPILSAEVLRIENPDELLEDSDPCRPGN